MQDKDYVTKLELSELEQEHAELSIIIVNPQSSSSFSKFTLQRLKKRKLLLKDKISRLREELQPDIIA